MEEQGGWGGEGVWIQSEGPLYGPVKEVLQELQAAHERKSGAGDGGERTDAEQEGGCGGERDGFHYAARSEGL